MASHTGICEIIKQYNPGSVAHYAWAEFDERNLVFKYIYI